MLQHTRVVACKCLHVALLSSQNELAAQRVIRLLLAEPSLFFKDQNTLAAVLMVVPQTWSGPTSPRGAPDDSLGSLQPRGFEASPVYGEGAAGEKASECTSCEKSRDFASPGLGNPSPSRQLCDSPMPTMNRPLCNGAVDRSVHMLIEMSGEGPGLDIRSFPRQIVQLISSDEGESTLMDNFHPQEDFSPHDSIILNSSTGEVP